MSPRGIPASPLAWRAAAVAVATAALLLAAVMPVTPDKITARSPADAAPAASAPDIRGENSYPVIAERPLFHASRRPWVAPAPPLPAAPVAVPVALPPARQPPRDYVLAGVIISDGTRLAFLRAPNRPKPIALAEGGQLDGWTLMEIQPSRLRFEADGIAFEVEFPAPQRLDQGLARPH